MHGWGNRRYLSVYNGDGEVTLWPGQACCFDILLFHSFAGKPRHTKTHTCTCVHHHCRPPVIFPKSLLRKRRRIKWERGGETHRLPAKPESMQILLYSLHAPQRHVCMCRILLRASTPNDMWHSRGVNHSCAVSREWLKPFSKQVVLEL